MEGGCGDGRVRGMGWRGRSECWLKSAVRDVCVYSSTLPRLLMVLLLLLLLLRGEDKSFVATASHRPASFSLRHVVQFHCLCTVVDSGSAPNKNTLSVIARLLRLYLYMYYTRRDRSKCQAKLSAYDDVWSCGPMQCCGRLDYMSRKSLNYFSHHAVYNCGYLFLK